MAREKQITLSQKELDALVQKQAVAVAAQIQQEQRVTATTVSFEKFNGFDTVRVKGPFGKGGFTLGLNKMAALYTEPIMSQIVAHLKSKGKKLSI